MVPNGDSPMSKVLDTIIAQLRGGDVINPIYAEAVLDAVSVVVADMETGEILFTTASAERMFGYHVRGDLIGMQVEVLVPDMVASTHGKHRKSFADHPSPRAMGGRSKLQGKRKDGSLFDLKIGLNGAKLDGRRCAIAIILEEAPTT